MGVLDHPLLGTVLDPVAAPTNHWRFWRNPALDTYRQRIGPPHPPGRACSNIASLFYTLLDIPIAYGIDTRFYSTMAIGRNNCQWLTSGSTELCARRCIGEFCKVHLARLRKGGGTKPCKRCGKGVYNRFSLCHGCGCETDPLSTYHVVA